MPDVASLTEVPWGPGTAVTSDPLSVLWGLAELVTSLGGPYTPGEAPPGSTPTASSTAADFVIAPSAIYQVVHSVSVVDLRDDTPIEFDSMSLSCDDGSVCWTLNASGENELFARFTTGDVPVIEVTINGNVWRFIIEGVRRERGFQSTSVSITGRSQTIIAGEPYQFAENWVNAGPATAQQIMAQAQVYSGLEIDWQIDDWLVPDRAWSFSGTPLGVVQRVAESVSAVLRSDRVENRISVLPRYRELPNEWRVSIPEVEIHLDAHMADSWERADRPAYNGVFVSGRVDGAIAFIYLAGTSGERLAPMVTDDLLTEIPAARQRGEAVLGSGGPQANVQITLPVLNDPSFPGVFEVNWLCRIVEPGRTWYGVTRAVSVQVGFPSVLQTITLEVHTADIDGTIVPVPTPPAQYLAWRVPINLSSGTAAPYEANGGSAPYDSGTATIYYATITPDPTGTVIWSSSWSSPINNDAAPNVTQVGNSIQVTYAPGEIGTQTSRGTLMLTATVNGNPVANRLIMVTAEDVDLQTLMTWASELLP